MLLRLLQSHDATHGVMYAFLHGFYTGIARLILRADALYAYAYTNVGLTKTRASLFSVVHGLWSSLRLYVSWHISCGRIISCVFIAYCPSLASYYTCVRIPIDRTVDYKRVHTTLNRNERGLKRLRLRSSRAFATSLNAGRISIIYILLFLISIECHSITDALLVSSFELQIDPSTDQIWNPQRLLRGSVKVRESHISWLLPHVHVPLINVTIRVTDPFFTGSVSLDRCRQSVLETR